MFKTLEEKKHAKAAAQQPSQQPTGTAPQPSAGATVPPTAPVYQPTSGSTNRWIGIVRTVAMITMVLDILGALIGGVAAGVVIGGGEGFLAAIAIIIVGTVLAVVAQALMMMLAQAAEDVSDVKNMLLAQQQGKQ